jgi:hypothetical protein
MKQGDCRSPLDHGQGTLANTNSRHERFRKFYTGPVAFVKGLDACQMFQPHHAKACETLLPRAMFVPHRLYEFLLPLNALRHTLRPLRRNPFHRQ